MDYYFDWFKKYTDSFLTDVDSEIKENILLKRDHSYRVSKNAEIISKNSNFSAQEVKLATICGLFHDIGRFVQFTKYKTFKDENGIYHGALGVEVLINENILDSFSNEEKSIILNSVNDHGLKKIPDERQGKQLKFSKLIRDADKTDIFSIVAKYYKSKGPRNIALEYGLKDSPQISEKVFEYFKKKITIDKNDLQTLNDFKLMQIAWIFDLNFNYTKQILKEKSYLDVVLASININNSQKEEIKLIIDKYFESTD
jgi:HD superfamily phosphodiesterase